MALFKLDDRYPDYKNRFFDGYDIKGTDVYARSDSTSSKSSKVGSVHNILIDEQDRFRYLVIDTGFWVFGKRVLLPIGRCVDDPERDRIYALGLTPQQVENLPDYRDDMAVDPHYEEQVRSIYQMASVERSAPVEMSVPVETVEGNPTPRPALTPPLKQESAPLPRCPETTNLYEQTPDLYRMNDQNHHRLRLYEERLVADKHREKTGEVRVYKRVETRQVEASVPIQTEKIVIEIESVGGVTQVHTPEGELRDGGAMLETHAEQVNLRKEPVVRQEVTIRKEVDQDVVTAHETLRREELDVKEIKQP